MIWKSLRSRIGGLLALDDQHGSVRPRRQLVQPIERPRFGPRLAAPLFAALGILAEGERSELLVVGFIGGVTIVAHGAAKQSAFRIEISPSVRIAVAGRRKAVDDRHRQYGSI